MVKKTTSAKSKHKPTTTKSKITPGRVFIFTFGVAAIGGAVYLVREYYRNQKTDTKETTPEQPKEKSSARKYSNPSKAVGDAFPLKKGSKGQRVIELQQALANALGQDVMAKNGGIDGVFGKGTENALKLAGYEKTVSEALFNQIVKNEPTIIFNPLDLAEKLYHSAESKNSTGVLNILKQIGDVSQYTAVNEAYKKMGFVSKTIVTHLLDQAFPTDSYAQERIKYEFLRMGLKLDEDSGKWSLSGWTGIRDIITIVDTYVVDRDQNRIKVSKNTILGDEQQVQNGMTMFKAIDNSYGAVPTEHVRYV